MDKNYTKIDNQRTLFYTALLFVAYMAVVMTLCLASFSNNKIDINLNDYFLGIRLDRIVHFSMFLPFPFICWLFIKHGTRLMLRKSFRYVAIIVAGILFAAIAESSQELFTTYRDSDPVDFCANITGIFTGSVVLLLFEKQLDKILYRLFRI